MKRVKKDERGVALLMALAILVIVSMLGTAYVRYALIDNEATKLETNAAQAQAIAERALQKAILQSVASLQDGSLSDQYRYDSLELYETAGDGLEASDRYYGAARVFVTDETAKLNINYAPVRLLESVLGVSADTARRIRASVPRPGESPGAERSWFVHPDELVVRGLLTQEEYDAIPMGLLTTHTVPGQAEPKGFINVNTAKPALLGAIVGGDATAGEAIAASRPFADFAAFVEAAGKQPSEFAIPPSANAANGMPDELALESRLYRFQCDEAQLKEEGIEKPVATAQLEAVVYFDAGGGYHILSWRSPTVEERADAPVEAVE